MVTILSFSVLAWFLQVWEWIIREVKRWGDGGIFSGRLPVQDVIFSAALGRNVFENVPYTFLPLK